ncbi:hypothetical protein O6H91_19G060200 [Diphasiastrum complanatum]|uniref:Uncharacterized protein n=1 Tax=Diphasiastrum complanatum TaxID=34168 RepID=A0ACC2AVM8_DIPCM|nr:hypothetical protein O6H91_19G060200 [Diphasiastrum complanatum]
MATEFGASSGGGLFGSTPAFGGSLFGSTPAFGASSSGGLFGSTTPAFGAAGSTPSLFGASTPQSGAGLFGSTQGSFGQPFASPAFGQTQASLFGQTQQQPFLFGQSSPSLFGQPQTPAFGQMQPQPSMFGASQPSLFGASQPSLFGASQPSLFGASQPSLFGASQPSLFGASQPSLLGQSQPSPFVFNQPQQGAFGSLQQPMFNSGQLTTQMAPVAPLAIPLPDREIQAIIDAYKDDPGNPRYAFKHLLLSITDQAARVKPINVSDIMWAEAMNKLEGMDSVDRERLWPELMHGFKDLSRRLKLQDEALASDVQRLQVTEGNVKLLQRHFQVDTIPWIERLKQKERELQRRLLRVMRIVEALEGKGLHIPLTKGEAHLAERLLALAKQLQPGRADLQQRVDSLLSLSRIQANAGGSSLLLGAQNIDEQSLADIQEVLRQQTEAIARLASVLKRDMRDIEIIGSEV